MSSPWWRPSGSDLRGCLYSSFAPALPLCSAARLTNATLSSELAHEAA